MANSIFPNKMMEPAGLTIESVASRLLYFQEQIHLLHWQTDRYAEHIALGKLYEFIEEFRDDVVEKLMGYAGRKIGMITMPTLANNASCVAVVADLITFAKTLEDWGEQNNYCDIENLAQELSGTAAKIKYLLTLK
jgi:hypothetical protein